MSDAACSFSVVTVTRNDLASLQRTADSVRAQGAASTEWIVIDGASTDGTPAWLESHLRDDHEIFVSEPDDGIYAAMNKGLRLAKADYVVFLNSGDAFASDEILGRVARAIAGRKTRPALVYGDAIERDADERLYYRKSRPHRLVWKGMFACHQAMFFERERIAGRGFDERFRIAADYELVLRLLLERPKVVRLDTPVCVFALGGVSIRQRRELIADNNRIRKQAGMPKLLVWLTHLLAIVDLALNERFPWLRTKVRTRRVMEKRPPSPG